MTVCRMPLSQPQLRSLLVDPGLVTADDFETAAKTSAASGRPIDEVLVANGVMPDRYLGQIIADALGFPFVRLENISIADHVLQAVPERVARSSRAVAFGMDDGNKLRVAMRDPDDLETLRFIEKKMGLRAVPYYATALGLEAAIEHYAKDLGSAISRILEGAPTEDVGGEEGESRVISVVELVMNYAYQNNASDVHIEPREKEIVVRYRIDGILHDVVMMPRAYLEPVVSRIKILSKMRTDEHYAAQDGKFQEIINGVRIDVRVSVLPVVDGEKVVMRLLTEKGKRFTLRDLGLSEHDLKVVDRHTQKSFGMILATGPTGSGKTTTMYAVLKVLNTRDVNIATIEDPIEYAIEGVNQIQVNPKTGLTFASGLRSIVRQDPDIIMVGEVRDEETAGISVNAAMTGHLVLSTLHTNDAATTLPRLRDMKIEPFLIASSVNLIIAQRLVRKICPRCIMSYEAKLEEVKSQLPSALFAQRFKGAKKKTVGLYRGKGCPVCNRTGYQGRVGIYETLEIEDNIRELIMRGAPGNEIAAQAVKNGMVTMLEDGLDKALTGVTTMEEVVRVAGVA